MGPTPYEGAAKGAPAPSWRVGPLWASSAASLRHLVSSGKIAPPEKVSSNSENISRLAFLEYKNSRKQELALRHLVNRLVPENV